MEWSDVVPHLRGLAHLATSSADGDPHVAVVAPVIDGDRLWVFTRSDSGKAKRIAANGRVALMWQSGSETYLYADAELVDDLATKQALWSRTDLPFDPAGFFGSADDPGHVLVRIRPRRAVVMTHDAAGLHRNTWQR